VAKAVASEVAKAGYKTKVARRHKKFISLYQF
jgi:hypothetical protein